MRDRRGRRDRGAGRGRARAGCSTPRTSTWTSSSVPGIAADRVDLTAPVAENLAGWPRPSTATSTISWSSSSTVRATRSWSPTSARPGPGSDSSGTEICPPASPRRSPAPGCTRSWAVGGAPEGVLTAAAMRCLNGAIQGRLVLTRPSDAARMKKMGITDIDRIYRTEDLAPGRNIIFAAAGVTDGAPPPGGAVLPRRDSGPLPRDDHDSAAGPLHRHDPRRGRSRIR